MFVYAVKSSKKKLAIIGIAVAAIVAVLIAVFTQMGTQPSSATQSGVTVKAGNAQERIAFLAQFGWDIKEDPLQVEEVLVPAEFDEVYEKYNDIQKRQEFDLAKYKGCRVKRWTYEILNYPGQEASAANGAIRANVLVYEGAVIGGDVCSVALDGFMHGFERPDGAAAATTAQAKQS